MAVKNIESVLLEERSFPPTPDFAAKAGLKAADVGTLLARIAEHDKQDPSQFTATRAQCLKTRVPLASILVEPRSAHA